MVIFHDNVLESLDLDSTTSPCKILTTTVRDLLLFSRAYQNTKNIIPSFFLLCTSLSNTYQKYWRLRKDTTKCRRWLRFDLTYFSLFWNGNSELKLINISLLLRVFFVKEYKIGRLIRQPLSFRHCLRKSFLLQFLFHASIIVFW